MVAMNGAERQKRYLETGTERSGRPLVNRVAGDACTDCGGEPREDHFADRADETTDDRNGLE